MMKMNALGLLLIILFVGQMAWTDTEKNFKHLVALIKMVDNDNLSLNFSELPIHNTYSSTFFKPFKNVAITDINVVSQSSDVIVFQGTISVAQQTMLAEFTIMGDRYDRISDRPLITTTKATNAPKVIQQVPSEDYLNQNPVSPFDKLHTQEEIHSVVGNFIEPSLLSVADVEKRNRQQEEVVKSYFTTQKRLNAVATSIRNLSERDKKALSTLGFSVAIVVPTLNLSALTKKIDYRLAESLELLDVKDAIFIYSTRRYTHPNLKREIEEGLNMTALIKTRHIKHDPLRSSLKLINKYTKISGIETIIVNGVIAPEMVGSNFIVDLPGSIKIGKRIESKGIRLRVQMVDEKSRIMLSVIGKFILNLRQQDTIEMLGSLNLTPPSVVTLTAEIPGVLKNPFGVSSITLEDVAMEIGTDFELVMASEGLIPISNLGGRARMRFPSGWLELALFVSLTEQERLLIYGDFEGTLSLKDLTRLSLRMHADESRLSLKKLASIEEKIMKHVPDLVLRDAQVYVSPVHQIIANKEYHKGFSIKAYVDVWDDQIQFESKVSSKGIHALAYMPEFSLGPLQIKGSHFLSDVNNVYQLTSVSKVNASSGPIISLDINPREEKSEIFIDGAVESNILGGIYADARIYLEKGGARLQIKEKIGNVFESTIDFSTLNHVDSRDLELRGTFSQQALLLLAHKIRDKALASRSDMLAKVLSNVENYFELKQVNFQADREGMERNDLMVSIQLSLAKNKFELNNLNLDFDDVKGCVNEIYQELLDKIVNHRITSPARVGLRE